MKKLLILLYFFVACSIGFAQIDPQISFGPYLTYSGKAGKKTERMTVHIGRPVTDNQIYYVAYWKSGGTVKIKKMDTRKVVNTTKGEAQCDQAYLNTLDSLDRVDPKTDGSTRLGDQTWLCSRKPFSKYAVYSATLSDIDSSSTYSYLVSTNAAGLLGYTFSNKTTITSADLKAANGKLLVKQASLSGSFSGAGGSIAFTDPLGMTNPVFYTGVADAFIPVPCNGIFSFTVPNSDASALTCFVTSDTQDAPVQNRFYFRNMFAMLSSTARPSMIIHAGDVHDDMESLISHHLPWQTDLNAEPPIEPTHTALFSSVPLQVAEGNHDVGYSMNYSADGIVATDAEINLGQQKYTKEMIWYDKIFQQDMPGLKTKVKVMQNGVPTLIDDLYSHYYSFDNGPVHFCMLDYDNLYHQYPPKDTGYVAKQLRWLADDLAASNKPFKVIVVHNYNGIEGTVDISYNIPFNYGGVFSDDTFRRSKDILDEIITKRGVAVVISGHYHDRVALGVNDKVSINERNNKKYIYFNIGNSAIAYDSYYTLTFNSDNTLFYTRYNTQNVGVKSSVYQLNSINTIDLKH